MVASILANEVIRVPISSFRLGTAGMSEALLAVASWAAREMAEATSHTTKPPPAIRRPGKARSAGIVKASVYCPMVRSSGRTGAWKAEVRISNGMTEARVSAKMTFCLTRCPAKAISRFRSSLLTVLPGVGLGVVTLLGWRARGKQLKCHSLLADRLCEISHLGVKSKRLQTLECQFA